MYMYCVYYICTCIVDTGNIIKVHVHVCSVVRTCTRVDNVLVPYHMSCMWYMYLFEDVIFWGKK